MWSRHLPFGDLHNSTRSLRQTRENMNQKPEMPTASKIA